jgi:hypothetical protein
VDPLVKVLTVRTDHFNIHFHEGEEEAAGRVADAAEKAHELVSGWLGWSPSARTEILINDDVDTANGSAAPLPYNAISIFLTSPGGGSTIGDYDDWLWTLIVHEYAHIVHLDMVYAIPWLFNKVMGKTFVPNSVQPRWFVEGLATYAESAFSSAGRLRSAVFDMYLRTAAMEDAFPPLDVVSSGQIWWPQGTTAYLYGSHFLQFMARRCGSAKLPWMAKEYASRVLPWSMSKLAKKACGETYQELYRAWKDEVLKEARETAETVSAIPLTNFERVTGTAQWTHLPRWTPGGGLAWHESSIDDYPHVVLKEEGGAPKRVTRVNGGGPFSFVPGTGKFVLVQAEFHRQWYVFNDIWMVDSTTGEKRRLTDGLRADWPDVSPEGRRVAYVGNSLGRTSLCVSYLDSLAPERMGGPKCLWVPRDYTNISAPRWSPDGGSIAVSAWTAGGYRDIYLVDAVSGGRKRLTSDRAVDMEPDFTPDGKFILFASDRTGIFNIHAIELETGRLYQVTNVLTGAFSPRASPDGKRLAFTVYGHQGYDVAVTALDRNGWTDAKEYIDTRPKPVEVPIARKSAPKPYCPALMMLPKSWFPVWEQDAYGAVYGLAVGGRDIAGRHDYALSLKYGVDSGSLLYEASYSFHVIHPYINLYSGRSDYKVWGVQYVKGRDIGFNEYNLKGAVTMTFPFDFWDMSQGISINYTYEHLTGERYHDYGPGDPIPKWPRAGDMSSVELSYRFSNARGYIKSISAEEGGAFNASFRLYSDQLGGAFNAARFEARGRTYIKMPWMLHHVLALSLSGGTGTGDLGGRRQFYIGGVPEWDVIYDLMNNIRVGGENLRGYGAGTIYGDNYFLLNSEYRFPIWYVERGFRLLPVYIQNINAALFVDYGLAWSGKLDWSDIRLGSGLELRMNMLLGFYIPAMLRIGYGQGFSRFGISQFYCVLGVTY